MTNVLSGELIKCVKEDDICGTLRLLDKGVDGTALDEDGWNLLQHACVNSKTSDTLLSILIRKGVDPLHKDSQGRTPLHWAARDNKAEHAAVLLAAGADFTLQTGHGFTPLDWAIITNEPQCVKVLHNYGATLNRQNKSRLDNLLKMLSNEAELEYLDLLGVPFFVEICMQETFPDLHEQLLQYAESNNLYELFILNEAKIEVKGCFLRLARRCFRIYNRLRAKGLNIETLLFRKYSSRILGRIPQPSEEDDDNPEMKKYTNLERTLFQVVYEVEKRAGMQG